MAGTITHQWTGTVLTITSDSGTSSCDLKGAKGDDGARGAQGAPGSSVAEDSQKLGGVAAAQYALKNNVPAHNLLDNSDFRNPVNQRGQTSYTGVANAPVYTIDRWLFSWQGGAVLTVGDGYIQHNGYKLQQYFEKSLDANKTYTAALCLTDGTIYVYSGKPSDGFGSWDNTIWVSSSYFRIEKGMAQPIKWAALYEGAYDASTLPAYVPKGYAAELAECQRYYENSWFGADKTKNLEMHGVAYKSTGLDVWVKYRVPKRIVATVTLYPVKGTDGWRIYKGQAYRNLDTVSARYKYHDGFLLNAIKGSEDTTTWTDGEAMLVYGHWEASADL